MKRPQNFQDQYQKRMNHQNNADLLLSVYELTARSSLQLANQKQRHQSQGRHFAQQYDLKVSSPEVNIMTSPKKIGVTQALSPHSSLSKPPISTQPQLIQSGSTQLQQLKDQLQKIEKKAASRKICIKKLYQLLEKNERELELYRTGKKGSNKNSFIQETAKQNQMLAQKKNELNEILNTVYVRKNKEPSYESMLLNFIQSVDPRTIEIIKNKTILNTSQESNQLDENGDSDRFQALNQSLKTIKQELYQKRDCEQALQNSLQYTLRMIEANQQIWRQAIDEEHVDSMTFEPYIKFMTALGFTKMAQEMVELEKVQAKIQIDTIQWIDRKTLFQRKIDLLVQEFQFIDSEDPIEAFRTFNLESQTKIVELQQQIEDFDTKTSHLQKEKLLLIKEHEGNQNILREQFQSLKNTYDEKLKQSNEQIQLLQNEIEWEKQEVFRLHQKMDLQSDTILKYEDKLQQINKGKQENQFIMDQEKQKFIQQIQALKTQINECEINYSNYREKFNTQNIQIYSAQIILSFEKKIQVLKQIYQNKIDEISKIMIGIQAKIQRIQSESKNVKLYQTENVKLQTLMLILKKQIESSEQDKKALQQTINQLQSDLISKQSDQEKRLDIINKLQTSQQQEQQKNQSEILKLQQQLQQQQQYQLEEINTKNINIMQLQEEVQNMQVRTSDQEQIHNQKLQDLQTQQIQVIKNLEMGFKEKEIIYDQEISNLKLKIKELLNNNQSNCQKIEEQTNEINSFRLKITELSQQLEQKQLLLLQSDINLSDYKNRLEDLNNQFQLKQNELVVSYEEFRDKVNNLEEQIMIVKRSSQDQKEKLITHHQEEIKLMNEKNEEIYSQYEMQIQKQEKKYSEEKLESQQKNDELQRYLLETQQKLENKLQKIVELETESNDKDQQFVSRYESIQNLHQIEILEYEKELDILTEIIERNSVELSKMRKQMALLIKNQTYLKNSIEGTSESLILSHIEIEEVKQQQALRSFFDESQESYELLEQNINNILKKIISIKPPVNLKSEVKEFDLLGQTLQERLEESTDRESKTSSKFKEMISQLEISLQNQSDSKQILEQLCQVMMDNIIEQDNEVKEDEELIRVLYSLSIVLEENRKSQYDLQRCYQIEVQLQQEINMMKEEIHELKFQLGKTESKKYEIEQLIKQYQLELLTITQELDQTKSTMSKYQHKINEIQSLEIEIINFKGQINSLNKLNNELKQNIDQQNKQITEQKPITVYCQALENLFNELLYNRVNLTSMKQYLNEQQREKLNDFRKKVGEIQIKLISADKIQKALDDCKFNLTQYQQIVDKSEMRARHFENECQKREEEIRELKHVFENGKKPNSVLQQEPNSNILSDEVLENFEQDLYGPTDHFLNFSLREEVLYGDKSFFDELSIIIGPKPHNLYDQIRVLRNQLSMVEEDLLGMHLRLLENE